MFKKIGLCLLSVAFVVIFSGAAYQWVVVNTDKGIPCSKKCETPSCIESHLSISECFISNVGEGIVKIQPLEISGAITSSQSPEESKKNILWNLPLEESIKKHIQKNSSRIVAAYIDQEGVQFFQCTKGDAEGDEALAEINFPIGSMTELFTAAVLMDRVETGVVRLDDPLGVYLPEVKMPQFGETKITLRHLATHTSGLPHMPSNLDPSNFLDYKVDDLNAFLGSFELKNSPGEEFVFSNLGMGLLGHILTRASELSSYEELVEKCVSSVLCMDKTHTIPEAQSHVLAGGVALSSSLNDLSKFLSANMGFINTKLLDAFKECHQIQCSLSDTVGVGFGWQISEDSGIISHIGKTDQLVNFIGFNPKTQKGLILLSDNTDLIAEDFLNLENLEAELDGTLLNKSSE